MTTVEQALTKVKKLEFERRKLQEKKKEIEAKRAEIQAKLKETEDRLGKLLAKQVLGELRGEKKVLDLEDQAEKLRRELKAIELAVQELQRRLAQMEEDQRKVYLEFFSIRRDQALKFVKEKVGVHHELALRLGALEKAIAQALFWLHRWESALAEDLINAGLEGKKAHKDLGPVLHTKKLDSTIYLLDLERQEIKSFEELWQAPDSTIPVLWEEEGLFFVGCVPSCLNLGSPQSLRTCAWQYIREGLGLDLDENQRKEEE